MLLSILGMASFYICCVWVHRDRYVELEMAKRLGKDESSDAYAAGGSMGQGDDELYEIPDSLKVLSIVSIRTGG